MPLDFSQAAVRIDEMAAMAGASANGREDRFRRAVELLEAADIDALMSKSAAGNSIPWPVDGVILHRPDIGARMSHQASSLFGDDLLTGEEAPFLHRAITQVTGFI